MADPADTRPREKLREQIRFIETSTRLYDDGHEEEGLRLANAMRMLFSDTFSRKDGKPLNISLVTQLGMRDSVMLSTPRTKFADWRDFLAVVIDPNSPRPSTLIPRLDVQLVEVPLEAWWEGDSVTNAAGTSVSRRRLVRGAADTDGGAHVDPKLARFYEELTQGEWSIGITGDMTFDGPPPYEQGVTHYPKNGHLALLRQFAFEVLSTARRFDWLDQRP